MNITDSLKTDLSFSVTSGGDVGTISGLANLKRALMHRLLTVPGTLVHRPSYGVGIGQYQNAPSSFSIQQKLAHLIQEQFQQDPRVKEISSVGVSSQDGTPQQTVIKVFITPVGYTEQEMKFTPFSEAL